MNWLNKSRNLVHTLLYKVSRALKEFLSIPTLVILGFVLLAAVTYTLDKAHLAWLEPLRNLMKNHVFANSKTTGDLLGTIAGSLITVTSITFSILLLAVQQSAAALTSQVFDQFLRRRGNQIYFGFFIGLALYILLILATVDPPFNPVFSATIALLLTIIAVYLLILLLYNTITQMQPVNIIDAIHDRTIAAREIQRDLIRKTRHAPVFDGPVRKVFKTEQDGFITQIGIGALSKVFEKTSDEVEVVFLVVLGSYVSFHDPIAEIKANSIEDIKIVEQALQEAVEIEKSRDSEVDPAYGIEQLQNIAWTSISTAKSNPYPGLVTLHSLRDLLARWSTADTREIPEAEEELFPVVYVDNLTATLLDCFETLAVVSTESMQHHVFAEVLNTFSIMFERLTPAAQDRVEDIIRRIIPAMGDLVLTRYLDQTLNSLVQTLSNAGEAETAATLQAARDQLSQSVGKLNSRATRVG